MKRINDLDSKDIDYLIDQIPFKALKGWYQNHPNEFAKLIKGFRPDSVSEEIAYSTAKKNKSRDFIAKFVDECAKKWLEEIKEYRDELEKKGYSPASALFDALPKSRFCDNIALYFLLSDDQLSENEISELTSAINKYAVKSTVDEDKDNLLSYKEKINELAEENKKLNLKVDSCEKEINQYKSEIEDIQILYKTEQQKNSELSVELDKIENLSMYADSEESTGEEFQEEYPFKDKGLSRKEAQTFQQIIKDVNDTSFYADFAKSYACTQADAEKYVSELIDSVDKYMEGQDLDTEIISRVLENSETFARKAEFLVKEDWERDNQSLIKEGTEKLENLKMQIKEKNDALSKIEDRCANFQKELDEREQIVKKAEEGLKRRTESLQETLGDYISSSTFLSALQFGK